MGRLSPSEMPESHSGSAPDVPKSRASGNRQRRRGSNGAAGYDLRHQELRDDEKGPRLARRARGSQHISADYKTEGIAREQLRAAGCAPFGWEALLNRAGTTFRKLPEAAKEGLGEAKAIALMLDQPSMIKRPVLDLGGQLIIGFKPEIYERAMP